MNILFMDFESYYSQTYSLSKMSPAEYILDPLFEAICLGVANEHDDPMLIDGPEIPEFINKLKANRAATGQPLIVVSHNAQFDASILSWRYDFHPDLLIDTMALSRTMLGPLLYSHALATVANFMGLVPKGSLIKEVKGMTRADIKACGLWDREVEYCLHDVSLCRDIYRNLIDAVPDEEVILHDLLLRCTTDPILKLDREMLHRHYERVMLRKAETLSSVEQMGISKGDLMSNNKLADVLRSMGVEPPTKISAQTHETTYAFAKSDEDFVALLDHPDTMVRTVVEARLETKSTIEETRTKRFLAISELDFPNLGSCTMPMPVIIGAAHTHRVGGGWALNVQNMGRDSVLRDSIVAREGHTLLVADSSAIEARLNAWFCGQGDLISAFAEGRDVYCEFASDVFERPITKANTTERFIGKTGILQLGYASGWVKFQNSVKMKTRNTSTPIELSDQQAQLVVDKYRTKYHRIRYKWRELDHILNIMHTLPPPEDGGVGMGPVSFFRNCMLGPTGLLIHFPDLHYVEDGESEGKGNWYFRDGENMRRTYGASLLETICQHLGRCIVMSAAVRLKAPMAGIRARLVHTNHDELAYHVPNEHIETAKIWAQLEMNRTPAWAPGLPLACEVGTGRSYGEAK